MECDLAASATQRVRLVTPLSKGAGSLGHDEAVLSSLKLFKGLSHGGDVGFYNYHNSTSEHRTGIQHLI